jgi:predicted HAD superfamily Cof-like phosphohydrolase
MTVPGYEYFTTDFEKMRLSSMTPLDMVREFASAMGQSVDERWNNTVYSDELCDIEAMRMKLIAEEAQEVRDAATATDLLKELADLVYVTYGYAATFGWDLDEAVMRIHTSNMSKLGADGKPIRREDGKILKGPNYRPPVLTDLV